MEKSVPKVDLLLNCLHDGYNGKTESEEIKYSLLVKSFLSDYYLNGLHEKELIDFGIKFMEVLTTIQKTLDFGNLLLIMYEEVINKRESINKYAYQMAIMVFKKACVLNYGFKLPSWTEKSRGEKMRIYRNLYSKFKNVEIKFSQLNMENINDEYKNLFERDSEGRAYIEEVLGTKKSETFVSQEKSPSHTSNAKTDICGIIGIKDECTSFFNEYNRSSHSEIELKYDSSSDESTEYVIDEIVDIEPFCRNGNSPSAFFDTCQFDNDLPFEECISTIIEQDASFDEIANPISNEGSDVATDHIKDIRKCLKILTENSKVNGPESCQNHQLDENDNQNDVDNCSQNSDGSDMSISLTYPYKNDDINNYSHSPSDSDMILCSNSPHYEKDCNGI
uniref:Clathrin assembly protein n=1 Tax=Strongyloides papillosus TaxID=174720 RepID=A0A0N5CIH2_STREA